MRAPFQTRNDSDAAQTDTAKTVAQKRVLADNRTEAVAQRKLAEMMNNSPGVLQQLALSDAIHNSLWMVAQRHQMNTLFGGAVKPQGDGAMPAEASLAQREEKINKPGLPNQLKSGIESLSGMSMDHVTVHYNSDKPAQLQAHAYAQGSEIHLGAGQERHLPHEAWHVVQQAQGRVRPTLQMKAGAVNDDPSLEKEADMMGEKAAQFNGDHDARNLVTEKREAAVTVQRVTGFAKSTASTSTTVHQRRSAASLEDNRRGAVLQRQRIGLSSALVIQRQGHTDEWNNYTRAANAQIKPGGGVSQNDLNRINPLIQQHIRAAADRYKDVHISFGSVIVISSPKALFHFSIDPNDATHSHFTFESYTAGRWLNDAEVWQSEAVKNAVSSPGDLKQWLLERQGERGMKNRLVTALEAQYAGALHHNVQDADVDEIIADELAKHDVMKGLNQPGSADYNPISADMPGKKSSDAHWRAPPDGEVMPANTQPAPQDIQAVWATMQQRLDARVNAAPPAQAAAVQALRTDIVEQTNRILQLGAMIYRRLPGTPRNTTLAMFSEANSNRVTVGTSRLDRRENAIRLMDNNPQPVLHQNGVAVLRNWA